MEIAGTLSTMALPEVLQWLSLGGKSGVLILERKQVRKEIFFEGGRIVSAASNDPREYFGQFLLRAKLLTEQELTEAFRMQTVQRAMLGKILVTTGRLTEEEVVTHLKKKAEETILDSFLWREAEFRFVESEPPSGDAVPISLDLTGLIAEGVRRARELGELREGLPSTLTTFDVFWESLPEGEDAERLASEILVMADDDRTVAEMCLELHESELTVFRAIRRLVDMAVLRPRQALDLEAEELSEALVDELVREGEDLVLIGRSAEAVELLRKASAIAGAGQIESLVAEAESIWRAEVPPDLAEMIPLLLHEIPREELSPEEGFVLSRAHGGFSVDAISKLAPFRSEEVLRIVKKYADRGAIRLSRPDAAWPESGGSQDLPADPRSV